jgi:hypothetical protein
MDHERAAVRAHHVCMIRQHVILEVLETSRSFGAGVRVRQLSDEDG